MKHLLFKKVPKNELVIGTEIAILKKYFDIKLIDDPKDIKTNSGARYYKIFVKYNQNDYEYEIKAYETQKYSKDRRLIVKSTDPIWQDREENDYLVFHFDNKISENSQLTIFIIKKHNPLYQSIEYKYKSTHGLVLSENDELYQKIIGLIINFNDQVKDKIIGYSKGYKTKNPLNQILYGPPGTGKTYSTITKALNILGLIEEKSIYSKEEYENAQNLFQRELGKRIEFVTMHQSFSYEDFVQGLKPRKSIDGNGIIFDYKDGVFKVICDRADESKLLVKSTAFHTEISTDKLFPSFFMAIAEQEVLEILSTEKFEGKKVTQKLAIEYFNKKIGKKYCKAWRDKFDFVLGEKSPRVGYQPDKFREGELEDFVEYSDEFQKLTKEQRRNKLIRDWIENQPLRDNEESTFNNHVIILDEINRANISRVFGELISLIEKDKRDGKLTVTLPSGEPFSIPSNLYIIGTMNTADKSIALVDIALRRRFKFISLYPSVDLLKVVLLDNEFDEKEIDKRVNLMTNLNRIIRSKKSVDFEIGHYYFMENDNLTNILNEQIIPLLNEYFMYDLKKVKEIIERPQKDREGNQIPSLGIKLNQSIWIERGLLEVTDVNYVPEIAEGFEIFENNVS